MDIKDTKILKPREENKSSLILSDVSTEIKPLPKKFVGRGEVKGYDFTLICKTKWGFCHEVSSNSIITHYEVFLRKINKRFTCEIPPQSHSGYGLGQKEQKNRH